MQLAGVNPATSHATAAQTLVAGIELTGNRQTIRLARTTQSHSTARAKPVAKPHQDPLALQTPKEEALLEKAQKSTGTDMIMAFAMAAKSRIGQKQALRNRQLILAKADNKLIFKQETQDANALQSIKAEKKEKAEHQHHSGFSFPSWVGWTVAIAPACVCFGICLATANPIGMVIDAAVLGCLVGGKLVHIHGRSIESWADLAGFNLTNWALEKALLHKSSIRSYGPVGLSS